MATYTPKKMYVGQPGTTDTLIYTAPAGGAIIKEIVVTNTTASAATISIAFPAGASGVDAAEDFATAFSVAANDVKVWPLSQVLGNAETVRALQGTSVALTVHISGIEIS